MSHWNIRILRDEYPDGTEYFFPAEVYYDDDGVLTDTEVTHQKEIRLLMS